MVLRSRQRTFHWKTKKWFFASHVACCDFHSVFLMGFVKWAVLEVVFLGRIKEIWLVHKRVGFAREQCASSLLKPIRFCCCVGNVGKVSLCSPMSVDMWWDTFVSLLNETWWPDVCLLDVRGNDVAVQKWRTFRSTVFCSRTYLLSDDAFYVRKACVWARKSAWTLTIFC